MTQYYRMFDPDPQRDKCVEIDPAEAPDWNRKGYGIFWAVNEFNGPRRIANLQRIVFWAVDIDDGSKPEQWERIKRAPLRPHLIVETKRGFQVYYRAEKAWLSHWDAIVVDRLVPYFGADKRARDAARVLRAPGYLHLKDPRAPFKVRTRWSAEGTYTEQQIASRFPDVGGKIRLLEEERRQKREQRKVGGESFWDAVYNLDCEEGLRRLSGHPAVGGEQFDFRRNGSGTLNIIVDGKGTSTWIDTSKRIGSLDGGGPTLYQWLRWYRVSPGESARVLKQLFPELEAIDARR